MGRRAGYRGARALPRDGGARGPRLVGLAYGLNGAADTDGRACPRCARAGFGGLRRRQRERREDEQRGRRRAASSVPDRDHDLEREGGGDGKVDLPKPYTLVVADVQSRLNLGRKLPKASTFGSAAFSSAASALAADVHRAAGVLGSAQPPYAARALHTSVLHQLQAMEDDFRALAQASDARDLNAASDALSGVSTALARVQADIRRIKARVK